MRVHSLSIATLCVGLVAITVAVYWPVTTCSFVSFDDPEYVYRNPYVLAGLTWTGWKYAWFPFASFNWHPLTWLSLELDGSLWGLNPVGYHATNLALHAANTALMFVVLRQITNRVFRSVFASLFFALHPLHVESVAWVSERKDVLSTFFLFLTIWAYAYYAARPSVVRYLQVLMLFSLGLLAKPMLVTLPILLLLLDAWPLKRINGNRLLSDDGRYPRWPIRLLLLEKIPMLGLAFADGLMTAIVQTPAAKALPELTLDTRVAHLFYAYTWYLQKTLAPLNLIVFYPHPERTLSWTLIGIGITVFFGISALALWHRRNKPHLIVGWLWFVISLLPVIGLHQVGSQAYADRYAYVPHIGLFVMIVWESHSWVASTKPGRIIGSLVATSALIACGILTNTQIGYWTNSKTLWIHAQEIAPESGMIHAHLVDVRMADGDYELAIHHIERGLELKRISVANAYCNWGRCLIALNRPVEAEQKFLASLKTDSNHRVSRDELAKLLVQQGRHFEGAQFAPANTSNDYANQINLGLAQIQKGNIRQASVHFEQAVQLAPQSASAHNNLAMTQLELKLHNDAKTNFLKAIELNPELAGAHFNLATIFEAENDSAGAKKHFFEVLRINPGDIEARQRLEHLTNP